MLTYFKQQVSKAQITQKHMKAFPKRLQHPSIHKLQFTKPHLHTDIKIPYTGLYKSRDPA